MKDLDFQLTKQKIRDEFELTLKEKVERLLKVKPHEITASTHFAAVSHETALLFRDGHYYGCISLTQAVAEALVKFMCQRNQFKAGKDYESNVEKLFERKFINGKL